MEGLHAGTEFHGSAVRSPSRTNLCILGTRVLYQSEVLLHRALKRRARSNLLFCYLCIITIIDCMLLCTAYVSTKECLSHQPRKVSSSHPFKPRETNAKLRVPNASLGENTKIASPPTTVLLQPNNPIPPSKWMDPKTKGR